MAESRWHQVKALFQAALDHSEKDRQAFVAGQVDDESVRAEVLRLLSVHDESSEFLESPIASVKSPASDGADPLLGQRLGGFVVQRRLGAGGMGVVYEALQEQPRRRAAVKVLRPGFAARESLRRFEYESEILAKLQHPGIAHVYAAGMFDLGNGAQPWFAMEFIEGKSLNVHIEEHALPMRRKLELLLLICDAVQHAHQRGVIHRDLKPANILVSPGQVAEAGAPGNDASGSDTAGRLNGQPKILDFGVARVIGPEAQATMHTVVGELVGTLSYMSPEQLGGQPDEVDARCDVYALGVIGYEMLGGRLPHDRTGSSVIEVLRAIERDEPKLLGVIDPSLRGDVETIFAKALEKDRVRRYQTAAELAADIRRHLNDEPILARPATTLYQMRKFARRNKALVGGVLATVVALLTGMVLYAIEARQARLEAVRSRYEADKATAINNFITNDFLMKVLAAANAGDTKQRLPVADLVDQAAGNISDMFASQPLAEAAVRNEVGTIYYNLGDFEKASQQFEIALQKWEASLGPDHPDTLKAVNNLGQTMASLGRNAEAESHYRRALDGRMRVLGEDDPFTLVSMNNLASLFRATKRLEEAETMLKQTLQVQQRVQGPSHKNTLTTMANLGSVLLDRGQPEEALRLHRQVYDSFRQTLGEDHLATLAAGGRLGQTLHRAGAHDEAHILLIKVVTSFERILGAEHLSTITTRRLLARVCKAQGRLDEAAATLRIALDGIRARDEASPQLAEQLQADLDSISQAAPTTQGHR